MKIDVVLVGSQKARCGVPGCSNFATHMFVAGKNRPVPICEDCAHNFSVAIKKTKTTKRVSETQNAENKD